MSPTSPPSRPMHRAATPPRRMSSRLLRPARPVASRAQQVDAEVQERQPDDRQESVVGDGTAAKPPTTAPAIDGGAIQPNSRQFTRPARMWAIEAAAAATPEIPMFAPAPAAGLEPRQQHGGQADVAEHEPREARRPAPRRSTTPPAPTSASGSDVNDSTRTVRPARWSCGPSARTPGSGSGRPSRPAACRAARPGVPGHPQQLSARLQAGVAQHAHRPAPAPHPHEHPRGL